MAVFTATVSIKGANGKESKKYFDLGDFASGTPAGDYALAENAITQITGAMDPVVEGTISKVTLTGVVSESAAPGAGDVFENAMINVYLDPAGDKVSQVYLPAPDISIFLAATGTNRDVVDTGDANLIQYIQQVSQHAFISDGEQIDVTVGNGMKNGVRTVRNLKLGT